MAKSLKLTKRQRGAAERERQAQQDARQIQDNLDYRAYDKISNRHLTHECRRRLLPVSSDARIMIKDLRKDDEQRDSFPTQVYALIMYSRTGQPPPYLLWDCGDQKKRIQESPEYATRLAQTQQAAAHNDALGVSLMSLPTEMRNEIYDLLFSTALKTVQNHRSHPFLLAADDNKTLYFGHEHALLRTCRALRTDALQVCTAIACTASCTVTVI